MENTLDEGRSAAIYGGSVKAPEPTAATEAPEPPAATAAPETPAATEAPPQNAAADPLAEAEERGYRRGLAEGARERFSRPAMWQPVGADRAAAFLSGRRPSVWD